MMITYCKKLGYLIYLVSMATFMLSCKQKLPDSMSLNGNWQVSTLSDTKKHNVNVPGIAFAADKMDDTTVCYQREIELPQGTWAYTTLKLNGARFSPSIYIDGKLVSEIEGGMASTTHILKHPNIVPGKKITLEIRLKSLKHISKTDASYIPVADHWRSNISACIWDDVQLSFHGDYRISRLIQFPDFEKNTIKFNIFIQNLAGLNDRATLIPEKWIENANFQVLTEIFDQHGNKVSDFQNEVKLLYSTTEKGKDVLTTVEIPANKLHLWSPENPELYTIKMSLLLSGNVVDVYQTQYGHRKIENKYPRFYLNNKPYQVRAGTVVWHRWIRNVENQEIGWDTAWFAKNIVKRLKEHGANTLRFHLGVPPERFLDLCDRYGLLVQYEWSFFHGMSAVKESLVEQWRNWLDMAMRHPSVSFIHPYNETEPEELSVAWEALNEILPEYPQLIMEDRDVLHVHKYWWSMFENVGLYYDDAKEFSKSIMVDEFGGNYLDGNYNLGGYKTLVESYKRFLGAEHTKEMRKKLLNQSNSQIAEYWRRIGAAGFSPFCILGSYEDGNHWFEGDVKLGQPKPVWDALTAAWSPQSVSLEMWDKNILPEQNLKIPLWFFNDEEDETLLKAEVKIQKIDALKSTYIDTIEFNAPAFSRNKTILNLKFPEIAGEYVIKATLLNLPSQVKYPVVSQWDFRILTPVVDSILMKQSLCIFSEDTILQLFAKENNLKFSTSIDPATQTIMTSRQTWLRISKNDVSLLKILTKALDEGKNLILLDCGEIFLGQGYMKDKQNVFLQGNLKIENSESLKYTLPYGISLIFNTIGEPESMIHAHKTNKELWQNLKFDNNWFWNGYRGGLIVPAVDMKIEGMSSKGVMEAWKARGADEKLMRNEGYTAYELQGFYMFSNEENDKVVIDALREKVKFLVDDAPALANAINWKAPIVQTSVYQSIKNAKGKVEQMTPLAICGKNLSRVPVVLLNLGLGKGKIIVSQLLTEKRLSKTQSTDENIYTPKYDPAATQLVINMIKLVASERKNN